jgi:hypothetical protein
VVNRKEVLDTYAVFNSLRDTAVYLEIPVTKAKELYTGKGTFAGVEFSLDEVIALEDKPPSGTIEAAVLKWIDDPTSQWYDPILAGLARRNGFYEEEDRLLRIINRQKSEE